MSAPDPPSMNRETTVMDAQSRANGDPRLAESTTREAYGASHEDRS
jgi:hypothetical protein